MTDEGGKFFDFQAKMADTLKVRLANLTLAWNNMLNDIGKETQGVLTWGIGALRTLFLHWRDLDKLIKNSMVVGGAVVGVRLLTMWFVNLSHAVGATNKQIALSWVFGKRISSLLSTLGGAIGTLFTSRIAWFSFLAITIAEAAQSLSDMDEASRRLSQSVRDGAKDNYKNITEFLDQYKKIRDSLYKDEEYSLTDQSGRERTHVRTVAQDIDKGEASKAWEAIREQIELVTQSSDAYIGRLLTIENMSERVRQGFDMLEDIKVVNAALKDINDDTIVVTKNMSAFWNLWRAPDGLFENLNDFVNSEKKILEVYEDVDKAREDAAASDLEGFADVALRDYDNDLEKFRNDLQKTTDSIIDFINLKGWSQDESKINAVFSEITNKLISDNQLDAKKAFTLQMEIEKSRSDAAKKAQAARIEDLKAAYEAASDEQRKTAIAEEIKTQQEIYDAWETNNGRGRVLWGRYTKWMKEQHLHEMTEMFRGMDAAQIASINFNEEKWKDFAERTAKKYATEHKLSYNDSFTLLENWVKNANTWSIFIPLVISTEDKKSVLDQLKEYDSQVDDADAAIERLTARVSELNKKNNKTKEETEELTRATEELTQAERDRESAIAKGGHGKKEKKDARDANKAQKNAETELQKALKEELSLIDKVRSTYKSLTKDGVDAQTAITVATSGFGETVASINKTLKKNGITLLDLGKYAGISNPRDVMNMLQSQLDQLVSSGKAKPSEIKDLQVKLKDLRVEALSFDHKVITDSLNNELGKLKDEYELAVELDANPEMGDMFLDMFDIDPNALPQTIDQYAERILGALNKSFEQRKIDFRLPTLDLTRDDIETYRNQVVDGVLDQATFDAIEKNYKEIQELREKDAKETLKKTQELQYKLADVDEKIAIETEKLERLRQKLAEETHEEKRKLLELEIKEQEQVIAKLKEEILQMLPTYKALFNSVVEHSAVVTRRLAKQWKGALANATANADGTWTITDPQNGQKATITRKEYGNQIDKVNGELRKTQSIFAKIKEAFSKGEDGLIDWAEGLQLVGNEANKAADGLKTIGEIFAAIGASDDTVEAINDVANTLEGLSQAGQGVAQIYSGDFIGGTVNVIKGTWKAVSTWLDNSDKKITRNIESSKRAVRRLQNAYEELEYAVEKSMGAAEIGARRAAIENKKLELAELERQLQLEKSRKKKKQDQDAIIELEGEVASTKRELQDLTDGVVDMLAGSDIKAAAEAFVDAWVQAWRAGENTLDAMNGKMDEMIQNLVKKGVTNKIVGTLLDPLYSEIDKFSKEGSEGGEALTINELRKIAQDAGVTAEEINVALGEFYGNLERLGILPKTLEANKQLSDLQQGIQGITEDTAGALEAYMNNVSQQIYLHTDILTQIRDAVVGFNFDAQLGTISQILLQLQYSYQTQMAIHGILEGVLTPSGRAFTVELAS